MRAYQDGAACAKPATDKTARDEKAQTLRKSIDAQIESLAKAVDETRASEAFETYLDTQARFRLLLAQHLADSHAEARSVARCGLSNVGNARPARSQG
jgi:hypothetical protein